jgi:hypothetical protein
MTYSTTLAIIGLLASDLSKTEPETVSPAYTTEVDTL